MVKGIIIQRYYYYLLLNAGPFILFLILNLVFQYDYIIACFNISFKKEVYYILLVDLCETRSHSKDRKLLWRFLLFFFSFFLFDISLHVLLL